MSRPARDGGGIDDGTRLHRFLRLYGIALGVTLGQLNPVVTTPPRPRPPIVRTRSEDTDALGFDQRERLGDTVLTVPLNGDPTADPARHSGGVRRDEPGWVRAN